MLDLATIDLAKTHDREMIIRFLAKLAEKISKHDLALLPDHLPLTGTVYGHAGTEWPTLGGDLAPIPNKIFGTENFKQRYQFGCLVKVYGSGCPGLRTLAARIDLPLRKIGATLNPDIRVRLQDSSRDQYAGMVKIGGKYQIEPGFDKYFATPFVCAKSPSPNSPVSVEPRAISVTLPKSMAFDDFEHALQRALQSTSLTHWASTPDGIAHFKKLRIDPTAIAARFTQYGYAYGCQPTPAEEIYIARPRFDGDRLVSVLENIILKHLSLVE